MARDVYSLRIYGHAGLTSAAGVVGPVVPSGFVYVVRDVDVYETSGTAGTVVELLNQLGGILWATERTATTVPADWQWRGRQVFAEGEQVGFHALSGTWSIACSGYQLTLP